MGGRGVVVAAAVLALVSVQGSAVAASPHHYKTGQQIPFYVNKVGPYFNTHETYHYYSLPVCRPDKVISRSLTLGEVLRGDRMAEALYGLKFRESKKDEVLCTNKLDRGDIETLISAIEDLYYFEFMIDDLPVRGFIGDLNERVMPHEHHMYLWTHLHFHVDYNGDQIVNVNVTEKAKNGVELFPDAEELQVSFTYSVSWAEDKSISFKDRGHHGKPFFPKTFEIHWLAIINSSVLVCLLTGFVAIILARALHKDFARYSEEGADLDMDSDLEDDHGWKIIHTDVFRFPDYKTMLCAIVGNGSQFLLLGSSIILMALMGMFNVHRHGSMNTAFILLYAATTFVSGWVSGRLYRQLDGQNWVWNIVMTACVFAVPFFIIWSIVNSVAWYQGSTQALPAPTIILLLLVWTIVGFPLTVVGGIIGKNNAGPFDAPCRTKNAAREIPAAPCYRSALVHCLVGGFLPFSAIAVELYYVFATVWGRENYTLYGILLLVFLILLAVTICVSVGLTYFQLSSEDYRWWWRSVFSSGFTGMFVFMYAVYYYTMRSNMSGSLQSVQFFGYSLLVCYVFFLMMGTIGFFASLFFVKYIYTNLKLD